MPEAMDGWRTRGSVRSGEQTSARCPFSLALLGLSWLLLVVLYEGVAPGARGAEEEGSLTKRIDPRVSSLRVALGRLGERERRPGDGGERAARSDEARGGISENNGGGRDASLANVASELGRHP